jgi:lycopene beta-cyclase
MASSNHFDYIIIGNGLAGLQLALALSKDRFFDNKMIGLIDSSTKVTNDKTWCFWEIGSGKWDNIVHRTWDSANFISKNLDIKLPLNPYTYKMIRSEDFYASCKNILSKKDNFRFIIDEVMDVVEKTEVKITAKTSSYSANHVFDSRIDKSFFNIADKYIRINQHFKGWVIETEDNYFNTDSFTMMDYRLKDGNQTTFTYVLPFSSKTALVEFTYFTPNRVEDKTYDFYLKKYISEILKIQKYTIKEVEKGNIPMTNFPFNQSSTKNVTKIGTAGGWVKGSTGYSFRHVEKKVSKIVENLKQNRNPTRELHNWKYQFYDTIFLKVLKDENDKGEWIFERFYSKNSINAMFRFLDEESSFTEELKIMHSLFSCSFIKAFFRTLFK